MKHAINKWISGLCGLLAAGSLASCSMMHEDLDDCPIGLYLSFRYDYNLQRANMFPDQVGAVTVYVFDANGNYVTTQEEVNTTAYAPLKSPDYKMHMQLQPGKYKFLVLAGQKSYADMMEGAGAKFVRSELRAGSTMQDLAVTLDHVADNGYYIVRNEGMPLDTLWHGMYLQELEVTDTRANYATISLVRDTKKINVTLRELEDPTTMDIANYDLRITDRNARILWNNDVDETDQIIYTPHATWNTTDRTPGTDVNGDPLDGVGRIGHADFMTSRLIYHADPADDGLLVIRDKNADREIVRVDLPDLLARLRTYEETRFYQPQEFLDRGYDYQVDFFLTNGKLAYINVSIAVMGWSKRIQFEDL